MRGEAMEVRAVDKDRRHKCFSEDMFKSIIKNCLWTLDIYVVFEEQHGRPAKFGSQPKIDIRFTHILNIVDDLKAGVTGCPCDVISLNLVPLSARRFTSAGFCD